MIKWVELCTIIFGLSCVGLSIALSLRFKKVRSALGAALSRQLLAEGIIGFITVIFAITSWFDLYSHLSPKIVVTMRLTIFSIAAITSINLWTKVKEIEGR